MTDVVSINVGKEVIAPIVQAKIEAAIIEHLADFKSVVNAVVTRTLEQKVQHVGTPSRYTSSSDITYLEWVCNSMRRDSIKKAIGNVLTSKNAEIEKACEAAILKSKTKFAAAFAEAIGRTAASSWQLKVEVSQS